MSLLLMYSRWHTTHLQSLDLMKMTSHLPSLSTVFLVQYGVMHPAQDREKTPFLGLEQESLVDREDLESQAAEGEHVHYVSMSMSVPACLAYNVLAFGLGMVTTVGIIWGLGACEMRLVAG